jgi:hypothetical protein
MDKLSYREVRCLMRLFYAEEEPDPHDKAERYDIQVIRDHILWFRDRMDKWTQAQWDGYVAEYMPPD